MISGVDLGNVVIFPQKNGHLDNHSFSRSDQVREQGDVRAERAWEEYDRVRQS
jgi:hypothetical protein